MQRKRIKQHIWSDEEKEYIAIIAPGKTWEEMLPLMVDKFGHEYSPGSIGAAISRFNIKTGNSGCFKKGHIPYNKGIKGLTGPSSTSFKKGQKPPQTKPVGSERLTKDGCIEIKVDEYSKHWKRKHRYVWEQANRPLEKGEVILFLDGNKTNCNLDNLMCIKR